jgi:hypothetical protein
MANVKLVNGFKPPSVPGVHYRLMCMTGERKGISYFIEGGRVLMGRGDNVDIKILDNKASREHIELKMIRNRYVLTDLNSQNGTIVNDLGVKQHTLMDGDMIVVGKTVYKFNKLEVGKGQMVSRDDDDDDFDEEQNSDKSPEELQKEKKKKMMIAIGVILVVAFLLDGTSQNTSNITKRKSQRVSNEISDAFTKILKKRKSEEDRITRDKLAAYIHRGLREHREGNYFRAIEEFNLALILSPNNSRASFYLDKTKQALDSEVDRYFFKAAREVQALKYSKAILSYCSILRFLQNYPGDQRYVDADSNIGTITEKLGIEKDEIDCLKEVN